MIDHGELTGRTRVALSKKLNPFWWFGNQFEQQLPDWYHPNWPHSNREFFWKYFRNPLQNFRAAVIGVADKNYKLVGRAPVMTVQRNDLQPPQSGFQWCLLYGHDLWIPRPFLSYSGKLVAYLGWQPSGLFGAKLGFA